MCALRTPWGSEVATVPPESDDGPVRLWPPWRSWRGVNGLLYARRPRSSPPIVERSGTPDGLAQACREREQRWRR